MTGPELDVGTLNQLSSENLRVVLRKIPGGKDLILEQCLMKPLDKFADINLIRSCGVDKVFKLENGRPEASLAATKVYMITPDPRSIQVVVTHLQKQRDTQRQCHLIVLPKVLQHVRTAFEEEGLIDKIILHSFMWELIPMDSDVLSLDLPHLYSDIFGKDDATQLSVVSRALNGLQSLFGTIPSRHGIGKHAAASLKHLQLLEEGSTLKNSRSEIGHVVVFDRDVDLASCLLSPLTYEALLDETFGVQCGSVEVNGAKLDLTSKDKIFLKIRNKLMSPELFATLGSFAKQLRQVESKMTQSGGVTVAEMKKFVQNGMKEYQGQKKSVAVHIAASEHIQEVKGPLYERLQPVETGLLLNVGSCYKDAISTLESIIGQKYPIQVVLRLLCLTSHCSNGIFGGDLERIKKQFFQNYGFEKMLTFNLMMRNDLLSIRDTASNALLASAARGMKPKPLTSFKSKPNFYQMVKKLGLGGNQSSASEHAAAETILGPSHSSNPSYVFNGSYRPIACKLVQELIVANTSVNGYGVVDDCVKELQVKSSRHESNPATVSRLTMEASKRVLVFFIGGYTLAEVAAFRQLQTTTGFHFIICGTSNITGSSMMENLLKTAL